MRYEEEWDKKLNINTCGRDDSKEDEYHYPYEPTPYTVLERLVKSGFISKNNVVVDYGCGKGRVGFFLNYFLGCKIIGIDFDEKMNCFAQSNLLNYSKRNENEIIFLWKSAEQYEIENADMFYFFNPFSVEILQSVVGKIKKSYYDNIREMLLFFYYPSDAYISYLMTVPELCFVDEIDCSDLFEGNEDRERIVIFEMM